MPRATSFTSSTLSTSSASSSEDEIEHAPLSGSIIASHGPLVPLPPPTAHRKKKYHTSALRKGSPSDYYSRKSRGDWGKDDSNEPPSPTTLSTARLLRTAKSILAALWLFLSFVTILYFNVGGSNDDLVMHHLRGSGGERQGHDTRLTHGTLSYTNDGRKRFSPKVRAPKVPVPPLLRPNPPNRHIPLPLPPNKVSVVLMNHSRPRMIRDSTLMRTLLAHPNIDEVILLHSNPKTAFEFVHPKVVNIDATRQNDEIGLSLRFYFCQVATNDWVIHVDDDMEFTSSTLSELLIEFGKNSKRIVGRFGRNLKPGNSFNGYSSADAHKGAEVILTKFMIMERRMCSSFFEHAHLIWDDVVLNNGEGPMWNGEDIFMSLVANHEYGLGTKTRSATADGRKYNNYAMDWLDVWSAPDYLKDYDNGKLDISGGMSGLRFWDWHWWQSVLRRNRHYSYRGLLWNTAKQRLMEMD